jgi:hypothetical protein
LQPLPNPEAPLRCKEKVILKSHAGLSLITGMLLITAFSAGCAMPGVKPDYLTVPEVWQDAESLNGKQVRVRGYGFFEFVQSLVLCEPARCDCNESNGTLVLVEEEIQPGHYNKINDLAQIYISGKSLNCRGDECTMQCSPFDPTAAQNGRSFRQEELAGKRCTLWLLSPSPAMGDRRVNCERRLLLRLSNPALSQHLDGCHRPLWSKCVSRLPDPWGCIGFGVDPLQPCT